MGKIRFTRKEAQNLLDFFDVTGAEVVRVQARSTGDALTAVKYVHGGSFEWEKSGEYADISDISDF